jgi:hypothetical protein
MEVQRLSEEDARRELELLLARDVDPNDPRVAQYIQHERSIRVSVRGGAPGTGKTHELFQDWNNYNDFRKLYLSHSHSFLSEQAQRLKVPVRHLFGIRRICPCLRDKEYRNPLIIKFVNLGFSTKHICTICKQLNAYPQKSCPYQQQFIHIKDFPVVVAPIEYVFTTVLDKYQPNYIAVDDCLMRIRKHPSRFILEKLLKGLSDFAHKPVENFQELISRPDYNSLMKKIKKVSKNFMKIAIEDVKNNCDMYDPIHLIPPDEINTYCKLVQIHGFRDRFATPALFPLFSHIFKSKIEDDEVQLKIIEAIPKMEFLNSLATRYQVEKNVNVIFEPDGFEPKLVDRGSIVFRYMGKNYAWYPTTESIRKSWDTRNNISEVIARILKRFFNNNFNLKIGLILPKNVIWEQFIPMGFNDVEVLTFGDLRGKNSLENCDVLFVIGTYCTNKEDDEQDFSDWYARDPLTMDFVENCSHGDYYHYKDKDVEILRWMREDYEMYQAIHRIRPLLRKKQIYVFGIVPKEVRKEGIKVITIKGDWEETMNREKWLENYMKIKQKELAIFVEDEFGKQFYVCEKWAYREVKKIVANSEHLKFEQIRGRWLVYVE